MKSIYILTDGFNSKIGITKNFDKRVKAYNTHNPNFTVYKVYENLEDERIGEIERKVKSFFKSYSHFASKEWFGLQPKIIDNYLFQLVNDKKYVEKPNPSFHGVPLTEQALTIRDKINRFFDPLQNSIDHIQHAKHIVEFAQVFGRVFNLGLPAELLPKSTIHKTELGIDINHCDPDYVNSTFPTHKNIRLMTERGSWTFYTPVELQSGCYVALPTGRASLVPLAKTESKRTEIKKQAAKLGWHCTFHPEWAFIQSEKAEKYDLILYERKTRQIEDLDNFKKSFKKFIIENKKLFEIEDIDNMQQCINFILNTPTFPLDVMTYKELLKVYSKDYPATKELLEGQFKKPLQFLFKQFKSPLF